jgi:hypothetical protein
VLPDIKEKNLRLTHSLPRRKIEDRIQSISRSTESQTRLSAVNLKMIEPDVLCATKLAIDKGLSTPSGDDLNQQSCLPLMAKDDDKNLTVLENERLENELSLHQSKLTDSSSKLQMFQNVHDELATTKSELEEKKREITDIKEKNLRLTNDDSQFRREIKDRDNLIASSQVELKKFRTSFDEQKLDKVHDQLASSKRALESKNRTISRLQTENLRLAENEKRLRQTRKKTMPFGSRPKCKNNK